MNSPELIEISLFDRIEAVQTAQQSEMSDLWQKNYALKKELEELTKRLQKVSAELRFALNGLESRITSDGLGSQVK